MGHGMELDDTMFAAREPAWHGLGVTVEDALTAAEALKTAGLDWEVRKQPVYKKFDGKSIKIPDVFTVERQTDGKDLGIVRKDYQVFQNVEHFQFADFLVDSGEAKYETAGSLRGGRIIYVTMKLPGDILIGGADPIAKFIVITSSHDGTKAISILNSPNRVVCANTLELAFNSAKSRYSIRHLSTMEGKLQEARDAIGITFDYMDEFAKQANDLVEQSITDKKFAQIVDKLLPDRPRKEEVKNTLVALFNDSPTIVGTVAEGNKWGAFNAVTEYADHIRAPRTKESQVNGTWFGSARQMRQKAFKLLTSA